MEKFFEKETRTDSQYLLISLGKKPEALQYPTADPRDVLTVLRDKKFLATIQNSEASALGSAISPITAEWVGAAYTPEEARTPQQNELLAVSDVLLAELEQADEYVIGVPMHNFGVPSVLKLWIDQIARVGRTFTYESGIPKGLLTGKKATIIIATGGIYDAQTQMSSFNFVEPYLRSVFGFLGVTDATFLTAGGTAALNQGLDRDAFLAPHLQVVQSHAQAI